MPIIGPVSSAYKLASGIKSAVTPKPAATPVAPGPFSFTGSGGTNVANAASTTPFATPFKAPVAPQIKANTGPNMSMAPVAPKTPVAPAVATGTGQGSGYMPPAPYVAPPTNTGGSTGNIGMGTGSGSNTPPPPAPPAPILPTETEKALTAAEAAYQKSLQVSPEELSTQEDIDKLIEATKAGYRATSNQPIALDFITGQMAAIEKRATGLAEPLERKMARLQAARTSSLEASKFALERADKKLQAEKDAKKPVEVGAGASLVRLNPETGKYEPDYTAPKELDSKNQVVQIGNEQWLVDTRTGAKISKIGEAAISASERQAMTEKEGEAGKRVETANAANSIIDRLINSPGLALATGRSGYLPTFGMSAEARAAVQDFDTLKGLLTLENMGIMKGVLSDTDIKILQNASLALNRGLDTETFKTRLTEIKDKLGQVIAKGGVRPGENAQGSTGAATLEQYYRNYPQNRPKVEQLIRDNPGLSDQDILAIVGFSNVGGDTKLADAIAHRESGGRYDAIGPANSKGQRAYGKYQIMDFNIPSWTKQVLGYSMTPQQFLANPEAQDAVGRKLIGDLEKEHGPANAASIWFTGRKMDQGRNAQDVTGTSGKEYVGKVLQTYYS